MGTLTLTICFHSISDSTLIILTGVSDIIRKTEDVTLFSVMSYWSSGRIVIYIIVPLILLPFYI